MKKLLILSFGLLFTFTFANAAKNTFDFSDALPFGSGLQNNEADGNDLILRKIDNSKKSANVGVIKAEHTKYMGTDLLISDGKNSCDVKPLVNFIKAIVAGNDKYKNLDDKTAVYVDGNIMRAQYMPWHPQDTVKTVYDADFESFGELEIGAGIIGGAVYASGDAFALAKLGSENQYRLYHYKAIRYEGHDKNAPFTEISGYDKSLDYKRMIFKECGFLTSIRSSVNWEYIKILSEYPASLYANEDYLADYFTGDEFRRRFIGDEKIEDVYRKTTMENVLEYLGVDSDRKTDKITKNVLAAKRISNTTFFTLSKIGGKLYIHKFELGEKDKYSLNVGML